jgi:hypothetical protein
MIRTSHHCLAVWIIFSVQTSLLFAAPPFVFRDVGDETGLFPHVSEIRGHGAAWGDVDGDGWADLYVATFHNQGSKANMFLRNVNGKFQLDPQEHLRTSGMGSGALFADFTNSGRLDLYVSNCSHGKKGDPAFSTPNSLFRNDGGGTFTDVSRQSGACPPLYEGRGVTVLDFDGDGLLDLLTCEQYYSPKVKVGPALYRNLGGHRFENVSEKVGLPVGFGGLCVLASDMNADGWPDIFLSSGAGEHRLYLNDGKGKFREAPGTSDVFRWTNANGEDTPAGACIADVNRDGLPDLVVGHHFKTPWVNPVPIRLYLHRGIKNGNPSFEDITEAAGLQPLRMKAPHVEIQDFDNDGWPDISVSIVKFKDGQPHPLIYKNLGVRDGLPRFQEAVWAVNDFPDAEDRQQRSSGKVFAKILEEKKIIYMAPGPTCDFDRDGRLDMFLPNWWIESRSLLLRNETPGGNWLQVGATGDQGLNRMGIGAKIKIFPVGQRDAASLIASREIAIGYGYCSGQEAVVHFGLGDSKQVDVVVELPHGRGTRTQSNVAANQRISVKP